MTAAYPYNGEPQLVASLLTASAIGFARPYQRVHEDRKDDALELIRTLHPTGYRDLRAILPDGDVRSQNFAVDDFNGAKAFVERYQDRNLYVGVAMRATENGGGSLANCSALAALFVDIDYNHFPSPDAARQQLDAFPFPPSAEILSGGGVHAYWFLDSVLDLTRDKGAEAKGLLVTLATAVGGDQAAAEPVRILRLPGSLNHKYTPPRPVIVSRFSNTRYRLADFRAVLPVIEKPEQKPPLPRTINEGGRNDLLFREGCRVRRLGWTEPEICRALLTINRQRCHPPLDNTEVERIAASCAKYEPAADTFPLTETGDAEYFAACFADNVRYDHRRGQWLYFDQHHWRPDANGQVRRFVLEAIRGRHAAALTILDDDVRRRERAKWALAGEARRRQDNLLAIAQNLQPIADDGDRWNTDPWFLGVPNGVVDLRTGQRRDGRPEDRITMRTTTPFDPHAASPLWDKTLTEIFANETDLIDYFDRYVGYSLTGDCREETLAFCWGDGANGKGTLMYTLRWVLGDYADDLPFSALELHDRAGIPNDIAKIVGKRFVTSSETGEVARLNEARVKALTGRDPITARFLHREFFTFQPAAKFWLATNKKPIVRDTSVGFWRRMHLIPFTQTFAKQPDQTLKERLRDEGPGILARAVRGCLAWQREGLKPPPSVVEATNAYREESMPLARFIAARCIEQKTVKATFGDLFYAYQKWCGDTREQVRLTRPEFNDALRERFGEPTDENRRKTFCGIGLVDMFRDEEEEEVGDIPF